MAPFTPTFETRATRVHETLKQWMLVDGFPFVYDAEASRGSILVDKRNGDEYLDLFSFFASMPLGHNHPGLREESYRSRLLSAAMVKPSNSDIYTEAMADFVQTFARTLPDGFEHLFFIEGGALAVENALKVAFDWKVRKNIASGRTPDEVTPRLGTRVLHFRGAFHGRTGYTLSLTNSFSPDKIKYFPKFDWPRVSTPGVRFPLEGENLESVLRAEAACIEEIERAIARHPHDIAAMIIETIQGEGGDVHFRPEFFATLRRLCDEHEIMLVFDEVQAGMGITGKWWAFEHMGVAPDIFCFGKKSQVCGIAATGRVDEVDSCFRIPSRINSTWGGNLVDMVRSTRYIELIEEHRLIDNAREVGAYLLERLRDLENRHGEISNARGRGLMCAFDLPSSEARDRLQKLLMQNRALILSSGARSLRFRPVLDFARDDVDRTIEVVSRAIAAL
jgi:L-lysine 6-transaminase